MCDISNISIMCARRGQSFTARKMEHNYTCGICNKQYLREMEHTNYVRMEITSSGGNPNYL